MAIRISNNGDFATPQAAESDRGRESFPYNYLPQKVRQLLREAQGCYAADLYLAFAVLCRRALAAATTTGHTPAEASLLSLFEDAVEVGQIDATTRDTLRDVLFGATAEPDITADQAAILIEVVKDIFFQRYVRTAKLRRAIKVRQLFADYSSGASNPDE